MPSSVIRRFEYSPERRELDVRLTSGRVYRYFEVPQSDAEAFRAAFSKGRYYNLRIKPKYRYVELDDEGNPIAAPSPPQRDSAEAWIASLRQSRSLS